MIIFEHYVTVFEDDTVTKSQYVDQVWNILQKSYSNIGGLMGFRTEKDLLKPNTMWKLVRRPDNKITAVAIYKTRLGGRKLVAGGSDGTTKGKNDFYNICREDVEQIDRHTWAEVSDALENIYLFKYGAVPIPIEIVEKVMEEMGQDISRKCADGFHYERAVSRGVYRKKIMMGNVPERYRETQDWSEEAAEYRRKWSKWNTEHPEDSERRKKNL